MTQLILLPKVGANNKDIFKGESCNFGTLVTNRHAWLLVAGTGMFGFRLYSSRRESHTGYTSSYTASELKACYSRKTNPRSRHERRCSYETRGQILVWPGEGVSPSHYLHRHIVCTPNRKVSYQIDHHRRTIDEADRFRIDYAESHAPVSYGWIDSEVSTAVPRVPRETHHTCHPHEHDSNARVLFVRVSPKVHKLVGETHSHPVEDDYTSRT